MQLEYSSFSFKINYRKGGPILKQPRTNQEIRAEKVHLIDENGQSSGIVLRDQALILAHSRGYDLVEVSQNISPPVCRLMDYGKYKYELEKKERKQKAKQRAKETKEIRLRIKIDQHDFKVKTERASGFLTKGHKVKTTVILRGRERAFAEKGWQLLEKFKEEVAGEQEGEREKMGNRLTILLRRKQ